LHPSGKEECCDYWDRSSPMGAGGPDYSIANRYVLKWIRGENVRNLGSYPSGSRDDVLLELVVGHLPLSTVGGYHAVFFDRSHREAQFLLTYNTKHHISGVAVHRVQGHKTVLYASLTEGERWTMEYGPALAHGAFTVEVCRADSERAVVTLSLRETDPPSLSPHPLLHQLRRWHRRRQLRRRRRRHHRRHCQLERPIRQLRLRRRHPHLHQLYCSTQTRH